VRRHIQRALKAGATKEEITAVLQLAALQGLHSVCVGGPILLEELDAAGERNATFAPRQTAKETP
jgi:alkylhydroperoxidase/carboxymuconolactone decarboxylase family protein YurZ